MRKARYDLKQVICRNSTCIGYSSNVARPGYWIAWREEATSPTQIGRVLGRIAETAHDGIDCTGYLAVVSLVMEHTHAHCRWIAPSSVIACYSQPPKNLMAWITGDEWVKSKDDIARIIAMGEHGSLSERYIAHRDDADKPYNSRPQYVEQFILKD